VWKMTLQINTTLWCAKETPLIKRFSQTTPWRRPWWQDTWS
jgi:hypothetical protein